MIVPRTVATMSLAVRRCSRVVTAPTANAKVATVLGSIPASTDLAKSEGRQMKQC
jgi:hypothetical protein